VRAWIYWSKVESVKIGLGMRRDRSVLSGQNARPDPLIFCHDPFTRVQGLTVAASSIKKFHEKYSRLVREIRQPVPKQRWWQDKKYQTARLIEQDPWLRVGRYVRAWMNWSKVETGKIGPGNEAGSY